MKGKSDPCFFKEEIRKCNSFSMPVKMTKVKTDWMRRSAPCPWQERSSASPRLEDFRDRLRRIVEPNSIMVLAAVDREELLENASLSRHADRDLHHPGAPRSAEEHHQAGPSFKAAIFKPDKDDFTDLSQIVAKMIRTPHGPPGACHRQTSRHFRIIALRGYRQALRGDSFLLQIR